MSVIITVTLNPAIDKTVKVKDFRLGQDHRENELHLTAGGKGINISRMIRILNGESIATGLLAGTSGMFIENELTHEKIKHQFLQIDGETRTNLTIIDTSRNLITRVLERGPVVTSSILKKFKKKLLSLFDDRTEYIVFTGSLPQGLPSTTYAELIELAKKHKIKTVLDTSGEPLSEGIKANPFMIKPNLNELEYIAKKKLDSVEKIKTTIKSLIQKGITIVVVSLGSKGVIAGRDNEILSVIPPKVICRNNVGSGDALIAGFLVSMSNGYDFQRSLRMGVATGTANTLSLKPGSCKKTDILKIYSQTRVKLLN